MCSGDRSRVECFGYDHSLDHCHHCLASGQCLRGDRSQPNDFLCLCPRCFYGSICEFTSQYLGFTLDSLIVHDNLYIQAVYIAIVSILFLCGVMTNVCSLATFARAKPRKIGVGNYLLIVTLMNKASLTCLLLKVTHIYIGSRQLLAKHPTTNTILCKAVSYFLSGSTRTNYWLLTWVTIERVSLVMFPGMTIFNKPNVAIGISVMTLLTVFGAQIHEPLFSIIVKNPTGKTVCTTDYSRADVAAFNQVSVLLHYLAPFFLQVLSTALIILLATRSRAKTADSKRTFGQILKSQLLKQKELYITPIIIIISALPQIIFSFSFVCREPPPWQRYILLAASLFSYTPQVLGFALYVLPSTGYKKEFRETKLGKILLPKR